MLQPSYQANFYSQDDESRVAAGDSLTQL
ncbi:hypothetical protein ACVXG7_25205 [Enterobacter hormaechei]